MMRRGALALWTVCLIVPCASTAQVLDWFPLEVGNRWIYAQFSKSGDPTKPTVHNWTTIETVVEHRQIPEGTVVVMSLEQRGTSDGGWIAQRDQTNYLIRGDCVYALHEGWDMVKLDLTPDYRRQLSAGTAQPDFCFPLEAGRQWGNAQDWGWLVEGIVSADRPAMLTGSYRLKCSWSQGPLYVWFKRGTGIVAESFSHSGTYEQYGRTLTEFIPAKAN
jgi:hypothetical protein